MTNTINNISCIDPNNCTGCMLCMYACTKGAIKYSENDYGFVYPQIDEKLCIQCKKCLSACPALHKTKPLSIDTDCYAAMAKDSIRETSSSGGAFTILANSILKDGGYVCGAAFDNRTLVSHITINNEEDLLKLQKSKYVQSDTSSIWPQLKSCLSTGKNVLFSGTPCQCAAVQSEFAEYKNLYIVDILCMGVASQDCWKKYLNEEFPNAKINDINFRNKSAGWSQQLQLSIQFDDESKIIPFQNSSYFLGFLKAITLRESCKNCKYAGSERTGDITIGDFWGIDYYDKKLNDNKGTSLVLVNTTHGKQLLAKVQKDFKLLKRVPFEIAKRRNMALSQPTKTNPKSNIFWKNYKSLTLKNNIYTLIDETADCGIINYWYANDHGAILTAYALQKLLQKAGYSSRLINICPASYERYDGISQKFELKHLYSTYETYNSVSLKTLNGKYKYFLVGSDQVFRAEWVSDDWFLEFVDIKTPKIAIAASFGIDKLNVSKSRIKKIRYLLNRFNHISVRESSGVSLCKKMGHIKAALILDPVFLVDKSEFEALIEDKYEGKYCYCYLRDLSTAKKLQIQDFCSRRQLTIFWCNANVSIEEFLARIMYAEYFITDSYHGLCFALIFNKKFYCYYNVKRGNSRFVSLIEMLKIPQKCFISDESLSLFEINLKSDYKSINENIDLFKSESINWILSSLNNPGKLSSNRILLYKLLSYPPKEFLKYSVISLKKYLRLKRNERKNKINV